MKLEHKSHLPGEPGIWVFVIGELTVFTLLFGLFLSARSSADNGFKVAQTQLHSGVGLINSLLLIVSSWLVATAMSAMRGGFDQRSKDLIRAAIICAISFLVIKTLEYHSYLNTAEISNEMFIYYFSMTGLHFLHVIIAIVIMQIHVSRYRHKDLSNTYFESCSIYWHMMDIIWLLLFTVFYIL